MTSSHPKITAHEAFRRLSDEFSNPYPPYVLVNSEEDAKSVLSAGCEPGYLLVLETDSKSLKLEKIGEFQGRVGIFIYTVPLGADLVIEADWVLKYLAIGGTAIGFATLQQSAQWKQACFEWAKVQKTSDGQHSTKDGFELEWTDKNVDGHGDQWAQWSLIKKAPEWAFC